MCTRLPENTLHSSLLANTALGRMLNKEIQFPHYDIIMTLITQHVHCVRQKEVAKANNDSKAANYVTAYRVEGWH